MGLGTTAANASLGSILGASAIASGISTGFNAGAGAVASDKSYELTRRLQKHDMNFQREMFDKQVDLSNTAVQRGVKDMQAAGINPAVALSGGMGGAGTPAGGGSSSASAPNVNYGQLDLASMMQAMGATALTEAQKQNIEADTAVKDELAGKTNEEKKTEKYHREFEQKTEQIKIALMSGELTKQQYDMMVNQATTDLLQEQIGIAAAERKSAENNRRWREIRDSIVAFIPFASGMTRKPSGGITINNN